jgi:hypothetical protein
MLVAEVVEQLLLALAALVAAETAALRHKMVVPIWAAVVAEAQVVMEKVVMVEVV